MAAALSALLWPWQLAGLAMLAIFTASVVDARLVRDPPRLTRRVPAILSRGVASTLSIIPAGRGVRIRVRQPTGPDLTLEPSEANGPLEARLMAVRRGHHQLPPIATHTIGPLRLGSWYHRVGDTASVVVYPDMPAARRMAVAVRTGRFREEGRRSRGPLGLGTDFESIRGYDPDDDIRQLNARATARLGTPMTSVYRIEQDRDVICLIDCGRLMAAPIADRTRLDAAVDAVAAISAVADQLGDRVGVVAFDESILRRVRPRRGGGEAVARAIFDLEPAGVDSDFELAFRSVVGHKRALIIILTDLLDEAAGAPLADAVPILARHHAVAVASVVDQDLIELIATPSPSIVEATQTAVAVDLLARKDELVTKLRHRGAEIIEAPLETYSARCVAAYLRAKRRARL